jgi:hypothetical protein
VGGCCGYNEGGRGSCINGDYVDKWGMRNLIVKMYSVCRYEPLFNCKCVDNICKGFQIAIAYFITTGANPEILICEGAEGLTFILC